MIAHRAEFGDRIVRCDGCGVTGRGRETRELLEGNECRLAAGVVVAIGVRINMPVGCGRECDLEMGAVAGSGVAGNQCGLRF